MLYTRLLPCYVKLFQTIENNIFSTFSDLFRNRSPLLTESRLISFLSVTKMFQFTKFIKSLFLFTEVISKLPHVEKTI